MRLGRLGRGVRPAGDRARRPRTHPLRPQNPYAVSKASSGLARPLLRRRARPARDPRPRVQPRRPGPGADLRDRELRPPVRARASTRATTRSAIVTGSPDTRRDFTDVRDVVRAYRLLAEHGEPGVYNVCSGVSRSARELIAALGEVAGVAVDHRGRPGQGPRPRGLRDPRLRRPPHAATGWHPEIPLEQTLARHAR